MSDEELDAALAERFKEYEAGIHLSDEFKERFAGSLRRKRALRRIWALGLLCSTVLAGAAIVNFTKPAVAHGGNEYALTARDDSTDEASSVSCWMLLGYLRECLGRSRPARRKEDE